MNENTFVIQKKSISPVIFDPDFQDYIKTFIFMTPIINFHQLHILQM